MMTAIRRWCFGSMAAVAACATTLAPPEGAYAPERTTLSLVSLDKVTGSGPASDAVVRAKLDYTIQPFVAKEYLLIAQFATRLSLTSGPGNCVRITEPAGEVTIDIKVADALADPLAVWPARVKFLLVAPMSAETGRVVNSTELAPFPGAKAGPKDSGLALHLPLDANFDDRSANARRATVHGDVAIVAGSAHFDGQGWLELPHIPLDRRDFAFSVWIRVAGDGETYGLLNQMERDADGRHLFLVLRGGLHPYLGFYGDDTQTWRTIPRDRWSHLVFQYRAGRQEIWLNGRRVAEKQSGAYQGRDGPTVIGRHPRWAQLPGRNFEGDMRDLRLYLRALGPDEVSSLYCEGGEVLLGQRGDLCAGGAP